MSSLYFLERSVLLVRSKGFEIGNIDSNIFAERPKLLPFFPAMASKMAEALGISSDKIQVKAKTMEGLGIVGTEQAIAAEAVALILKG